MARRKRIGKPFDISAMLGLVKLDQKWHALMLKEKKADRAELSDWLLSMDDDRSKAMGRALAAYHSTTLSPEQIAERGKLEKAISERQGDLDKFALLSPGTIQKRERFKGLGGLEFAQEMVKYMAECKEAISVIQDDLDAILNAKLLAGVAGYNREMDLDTGHPRDTDTRPDTVLYLPFARLGDEGTDLYMGVESIDKWFLFQKDKHESLGDEEKVSPLISSLELDEAHCPVEKHTRIRKVAHAMVKGCEGHDPGKALLIALCDGKVNWSTLNEGGVGHDGRLCVDVGSFSQWRKLHVAGEAEAEQIPEAEVSSE